MCGHPSNKMGILIMEYNGHFWYPLMDRWPSPNMGKQPNICLTVAHNIMVSPSRGQARPEIPAIVRRFSPICVLINPWFISLSHIFDGWIPIWQTSKLYNSCWMPAINPHSTMMFMLKSPFLQVKSPFSTAFHRDFPSEAQIFLHRQLATEHPA